ILTGAQRTGHRRERPRGAVERDEMDAAGHVVAEQNLAASRRAQCGEPRGCERQRYRLRGTARRDAVERRRRAIVDDEHVVPAEQGLPRRGGGETQQRTRSTERERAEHPAFLASRERGGERDTGDPQNEVSARYEPAQTPQK